MRCLSLSQPWTSLVSLGLKTCETRSWSTAFTGPLAIHASKSFPGWARELCEEEPFKSALAAAGITSWRELPTGVVLCTCTLTRCVPTTLFEPREPNEMAFGNYSAGRYAWVLADVVALPEPVLAKGALGLWIWTPTKTEVLT